MGIYLVGLPASTRKTVAGQDSVCTGDVMSHRGRGIPIRVDSAQLAPAPAPTDPDAVRWTIS